MPRLIDGDALAEVVNHWGEIKGREEAADSIIYAIKEAPTIEAEPVRHGEWEIVDATSYDDICTCSECGGFAPAGFIKSNYCPKCGAKMDGKENEE